MKPAIRLALFLCALVVLAPGVLGLARSMPEFGRHPLPYGDAINDAGPRERFVTNMVTAVNFDYRGFDTLGEEFMLLAAVTGTVVLLRGRRGETTAKPGRIPGRRILPRSDAIVLACRLFAPLTLLFGLYVALHAQLTPGGGFQGGVIIASGTLLLMLGEGYAGWRWSIRSEMLDIFEGGGAALFALAGFFSLLLGGHYLENLLPLAQMKSLLSGGLILVENAATAFAVAGGFTMLFLEFLEETREPEEDQPEVGPDTTQEPPSDTVRA